MTETYSLLDQKTLAEIEELQAKRDFHRENAKVAHVLGEQEEVALRARVRQEERLKGRDDENNVYVFDDDVDHDSVKRCVNRLMEWHRGDPTCHIEIQINSFGGDVFSGLRLIDVIRYLKDQGHEITTSVYGTAFSMGAVILQAGTTRVAGKNAFLMIHQGQAQTSGTIGEIEDDQQLIEKLQKQMLGILAEQSTLSAREIKTKWNRKNWWMTAEEALAIKLIDEVR